MREGTEDRIRAIVDLLARHEETIGRLYDDFAAAFPGSRSFWEELAREERDHAKWIRRLRDETAAGRVRLDPAALDPAAARGAVDYVNGLVIRHSLAPFDEDHAVAAALKIESAIVERRMMAPYEGISPAFARAVEAMGERSREHAGRIALFFRLRR